MLYCLCIIHSSALLLFTFVDVLYYLSFFDISLFSYLSILDLDNFYSHFSLIEMKCNG